MRMKAIYSTAALACALLFVPSSTYSQTPESPARGIVMLSYNVASLADGMDRFDGVQFEADYAPTTGSPFSFVAHVSNHDGRMFTGAGPRATWDVGPVHVFGHYLLGQLRIGGMHTDGPDGKLGGGLGIPIGEHWLVRIGADHDGHVVQSIIGIGARF